MKRCPKCGTAHNDSVVLCDCGYDLSRTQSFEVSGGIASSGNRKTGQYLTIQDIDIPFVRLVVIMVKFSLASVPAAIIIAIIWAIVLAIFGKMLF